MQVSTSQRQLFETVFDSLIVYANERLGTVKQFSIAHRTPDDEHRIDLIARALWKDTSLINDYVRENPDGLAEDELKVAQDLRSVIYDDFVFEGDREDAPVFLHRTGAYRATCLDSHWEDNLPGTPVILRMALVPFMGSILLASDPIVIGMATESYCNELRRDAARKGYQRLTSSGTALAERARSWQNRQRQRREEVRRPARRCGPGYHRGALAGMSGAERKRAQVARYDLLATESGMHQSLLRQKSVEADTLPLSLVEALDLFDSDWLTSIAQHVANLSEPPEKPRSELIRIIRDNTIHNETLRDLSLVWCEEPQFSLLLRLLETCPLSLVHMTPTETEGLYPMVPYVFILRQGENCIAWMPPEIHAIVRKADLEEITRVRRRFARLDHAARALASMCGIISLDEAYERYCAVERAPLDRTQFDVALVEMENCDTRDSYALWDHEDTTYLVSASLSDQGALARVIRKSYASRVITDHEVTGLDRGMGVLPIDEDDADDLYRQLEEVQEWLQRQRVRLLEAKTSLPAHPLVPEMLEQGFVDYLLTTEELLRVRDYVDEHVPDREDDYEFPEKFCRALVISRLFENESYDEMLDIIRLFGMRDCEGKQYPHTLGKLVTDVFNSLPDWVLNGWSLAENTARVSGRPTPHQADL